MLDSQDTKHFCMHVRQPSIFEYAEEKSSEQGEGMCLAGVKESYVHCFQPMKTHGSVGGQKFYLRYQQLCVVVILVVKFEPLCMEATDLWLESLHLGKRKAQIKHEFIRGSGQCIWIFTGPRRQTRLRICIDRRLAATSVHWDSEGSVPAAHRELLGIMYDGDREVVP